MIAQMYWEIEQMNVKTVFLYEIIDEDVYVKMSINYFEKNLFCKLNMTLWSKARFSKMISNTYDVSRLTELSCHFREFKCILQFENWYICSYICEWSTYLWRQQNHYSRAQRSTVETL